MSTRRGRALQVTDEHSKSEVRKGGEKGPGNGADKKGKKKGLEISLGGVKNQSPSGDQGTGAKQGEQIATGGEIRRRKRPHTKLKESVT